MGLPLLHVLSGAAFSAVAAVNGTSSPAVRSAGCGVAPPYDPAEQRNSERIDIDGRWYLLHLPAGTPDGGGVVYDRDVAHPLIMNFHGMGMDSLGNILVSGYSRSKDFAFGATTMANTKKLTIFNSNQIALPFQ